MKDPWIARKTGTRKNLGFRVLWRNTCMERNAPNGPRNASTRRNPSLVLHTFRFARDLSCAKARAAIRFRPR